MKSRLAVSFGGVANRERKHLGEEASGIRGARAPGRRIDLVFLGRLAFGPSPFGVPGRRIDRAYLSRLAFGSCPIGALGLGRLARGTEPGPMVPTMPPFSCWGERSSPIGKKGTSLTVILQGTVDHQCCLFFNVNFVTFFETALDAIGSFELILRFRGSYKRLVGE